ncbi:MAG: D-alanine--D-alanine ligase [Bacteroidales bacterium]|nr:D-alanine--D-alanine ligase [Bacteroidales bacterium]
MKKNIAVVYGGYSAEYQISILSGKYVSSIIDSNLFNVYNIFISKEKWVEEKNNSVINKHDFSFINDEKKINIDVAVIVIHGNPGEDGILQSYFDLMNIPYTTCNPLTAALTFNKYFCNNYLRNFDINMAKSIVLRKKEKFQEQLDKFITTVGFPIFIKPNEGGSSFGTYKIKQKEEVSVAIKNAFEHSDEVIVEEFILGREITCGVVKTKNTIKAFTPCEIVSKHEFFDYESKYNSALNEEIIPARFDNKLLEECKFLSEKIYKTLNCTGIVRVDYIVKENKLFFLELNSIPGMTSESIIPKMIKHDKINITELFTELILEALE